MSISFSSYAIEQLKARKIAKKLIIAAIKNHDKTIKSFKNRLLRQKRFGGKMLEVVTITEGSRITVVTAYYLEDKYYEN